VLRERHLHEPRDRRHDAADDEGVGRDDVAVDARAAGDDFSDGVGDASAVR